MPATARQLDAGFVSIKVDREERPDIDSLYMDAVQSLTGSGGWPMSLFLTPDGRPFFGGTYFPDTPRHGLASFRQVLAAVGEAWAGRRDEIEARASRLADAIVQGQRSVGGLHLPDDRETDLGAALDRATVSLIAAFDARTGGWGGSPKFPQPAVIEQLLREHVRTGERGPLDVAIRSLDAMADGGIRDHLGGGFARYATDSIWLVPHFEKMLYDNAQLASAYLHAWQVTGEARHAEVARQTLDFMARDLGVTLGDGLVGFAASLDADTDGHEGRTYVWTAAEVDRVLGPDAPMFAAAYGITPDGNWEGQTILSRVRDDDWLARTWSMSRDEVRQGLLSARDRLFAARQARTQPARDDKVLASWNGLAMVAFAEAGRVLPDAERYVHLATALAASLYQRLRTRDARLRRSWKDGRSGAAAVLEDHTHLAAGLLALYQTTFEERWLAWATELMDVVIEHFGDAQGGFDDTADDADGLFARPRSVTDTPVPSGSAMAVTVLLQIAALTGLAGHQRMAETTLSGILGVAADHPTAFGQWLLAAGMLRMSIDEVAIVGDRAESSTEGLLAVTRSGYRPWQVVAYANDPGASIVPLLRDRVRVDGRPAAYVCRGFSCQLPVTDPDALRTQLRRR